jgi:SOS response regulatory protein OraA/RecX
MTTITALRAKGHSRVAVELDGGPWRTVPAEVVVRAGLAVGRTLDRPALRLLRRELRRSEAITAAARALRSRDLSSTGLAQRLERANVAPAVRVESLAVLGRAGLVDDARFARTRAAALAERGYGDAAIRLDLERQGIETELRDEAIGALEPELMRARAVVARRGDGPRTARFLAGKGFAEESVAVAIDADPE